MQTSVNSHSHTCQPSSDIVFVRDKRSQACVRVITSLYGTV